MENLPILHHMQVPQLHHLFLSLIDVCELIQLLQMQGLKKEKKKNRVNTKSEETKWMVKNPEVLTGQEADFSPWPSSPGAIRDLAHPRCPNPSPGAAGACSCHCGSIDGCVR